MRKVAFYTLGCKMNFHETAFIREQFKTERYEVVPFSDQADIYVINTCTVTSAADAKSRKAIRRAKRNNPDALVVVTGCYSEVYPEQIKSIEEADIITGNVEKREIVKIVENHREGKFLKGVWTVNTFFPLLNLDYGDKSRAFVKIQQGCEAFCSYCIVPKARGRCLSESPEKIIEHITLLVEQGYSEIVLTGTHLGAYGKDIGQTLSSILKEILKIPGEFRIRLSSIEPQEFSDELRDVVLSERIAPHFHIPIQSGSDKILRLMRRNYTVNYFAKLIEKLVEKKKDVCIGTDVMVGFPGETDDDFKQGYKILKGLPVGYFHVFSYSQRRGTEAYLMPNKVSDKERKKRSEKLIALGEKKNYQFRKEYFGKTLKCISLGKSEKFTVLSGNYIHIKVDKLSNRNGFLNVKLTESGAEREDNRGILV